MADDLLRRSVLSLGGGLALSSLAGCLQLESSASEPATTSEPPQTERVDSTTETETSSSTSRPVVESPWRLSKQGSDIITHDGTFYLSTWISKELLAVAPDGTIRWRGDQTGKFKRTWLTASDSAIAGCGYGGQVTVFDQSTGEVKWHYTDAEYVTWAHVRPYMDDSFLVTVNESEPAGDQVLILIFDAETGDVVAEIDTTDTIESVGIAGSRLYIATSQYLDVYETGSFEKRTRITDFECSWITFQGDEAIVTNSTGLTKYSLQGTGIRETKQVPLDARSSVLAVTDDSIYAETPEQIQKYDKNGDQRWSVDVSESVGKIAETTDTVYAVDSLYQLYVIDAESGTLLQKKSLSPDGLPQPNVTAIEDTAVVMNDPIQAFQRVNQ